MGTTSTPERQLLYLWGAVREASAMLTADRRDEALSSPRLSSLMHALADDARRLSSLLEAQAQPPTLEPHGEAAQRPSLLVVDDDVPTLKAMKELLEDDYDVAATTDPTAVAGLIADRRFDAVITDLRMPEVDGVALLTLLQKSARPAPPVLMVSASVDAAKRLEALELGAFDFMSKPVDLAELKARINRAVRYARELEHQRLLQETDELTGLANRRAFNQALSFATTDRRSSQRVAVALIDQDDLKHLNDLYGHAAGDAGLVAIAGAIARSRRASDVAARIGGDEFALVMPATDLGGARRVLERVVCELSASPLELPGRPAVPLTISWGIATLEPGSEPLDVTNLLQRADDALYSMKREHKHER